MHSAVLRLCIPELIEHSPTENPTVILLPEEVSSHVEEARRKLYLHGAQEEICRILQAPVFCKNESIYPEENDLSCDILDANIDNEERKKPIKEALGNFEEAGTNTSDNQASNEMCSPHVNNEIKALLELKAKKELGGKREVKFINL